MTIDVCTIILLGRCVVLQAVVCMYLLCLSHFQKKFRDEGTRSNSMILLLSQKRPEDESWDNDGAECCREDAVQKKFGRLTNTLASPTIVTDASVSMSFNHHRLELWTRDQVRYEWIMIYKNNEVNSPFYRSV